jgi:hypothetical protein
MPYDDQYASLMRVLMLAYEQASKGKGKERHANDEPFENQFICAMTRFSGLGFPCGQASKKLVEATRTGSLADVLGAINYAAAQYIVMEEQQDG